MIYPVIDSYRRYTLALPSGNLLHNYGKSPMFHGKIHYFYGDFQ